MERVRLGVLVPATNNVIEPDMYRMVPETATVHFERLSVGGGNVSRESLADPKALAAGLEAQGKDAIRATRQLMPVKPKVIAFGSTSGSFFRGIEYDRHLIKSIEEEADGAHAITTSTAVVRALEELHIQKVCLITPYQDWLTQIAKQFLEANGFEVPVAQGLGLGVYETAEQPPDVIYELAMRAWNTACDAVCCSCTAFRAIETIDRVESILGKPMISANQAVMWLLLKTAGVSERVKGFGTLMGRR